MTFYRDFFGWSVLRPPIRTLHRPASAAVLETWAAGREVVDLDMSRLSDTHMPPRFRRDDVPGVCMTRYTIIVLVTASTNYRLTMIEDTQSSTSTTPVTRGYSGVEHSQLRHLASGIKSDLHSAPQRF